MDLTDLAFWTDIVVPVVQTVILAVTLLYLGWQTRSTQQSLRLTGEISLSLQTKDINEYLLNDTKMLQLVGYSKEEVFAFMLLNSLELRHRLNMDRLFTKENWQAQLRVMEEIAKLPFVQKVWAEKSEQYDPDFRRTFSRIINGSRANGSSGAVNLNVSL